MSNYNSIQTEGHNTYFSAADVVEADKAYARRLADEVAKSRSELIALIGTERAERAIAHFGCSSKALEVAKAQIAAGKCKTA